MTAARPAREPEARVLDACCAPGRPCPGPGAPAAGEAEWRRAARLARWLAWASLAPAAERRAQHGVAVSFWLLAPFIATDSVRDLVAGHHAATAPIGIALTAAAVVVMPLLGRAKHQLATRLGSAATAGEGTQNYLCAAQAAAVLAGLASTAAWAGGWWTDPVIGLGIAAAAVREGIRSWRGQDCC